MLLSKQELLGVLDSKSTRELGRVAMLLCNIRKRQI